MPTHRTQKRLKRSETCLLLITLKSQKLPGSSVLPVLRVCVCVCVFSRSSVSLLQEQTNKSLDDFFQAQP